VPSFRCWDWWPAGKRSRLFLHSIFGLGPVLTGMVHFNHGSTAGTAELNKRREVPT